MNDHRRAAAKDKNDALIFDHTQNLSRSARLNRWLRRHSLVVPYWAVVTLLFLNWIFDIADWIARHT